MIINDENDFEEWKAEVLATKMSHDGWQRDPTRQVISWIEHDPHEWVLKLEWHVAIPDVRGNNFTGMLSRHSINGITEFRTPLEPGPHEPAVMTTVRLCHKVFAGFFKIEEIFNRAIQFVKDSVFSTR